MRGYNITLKMPFKEGSDSFLRRNIRDLWELFGNQFF